MIGAKLAEAEVIIFLDSHMEVTNTWLPPLLEPIVYNPTYATVPLVEGMNHATFAYEFIGHGYRGTFDWNFRYQWIPFREERKDPGQNYNLSSMTGGAYAIRREHFFHLGGYDEELRIWNGENYELSLKLWLCSGGIFTVPCSRIVHLSKQFSAYRDTGDKSDFVGRNLKRVAEVWLDDYKQYFYRNEPERYSKIDAGNLTEQFKRKEMLKCKPFKYFLDEIAPEMLMYYPIEPQSFASFSIQHMSSLRCISLAKNAYHEHIILTECSQDLTKPQFGTDFILTLEKSIKFNDINDQCLNGNTLALSNCHHTGYEQHWAFNLDSRQIYQTYEKKCLTGSDTDSSLSLETCDDNLQNQKWRWGYENVTALTNWDKTGIRVN
ncbi:N-acetylgalactosaminyltransferase 4-like [Chironomus tepperi]|uniref:N-acetylgalactosaminyltransferase 4-like n=1 Tax=Chironomus tepperi TaxID=113505 RepID=UPI00391EFB18